FFEGGARRRRPACHLGARRAIVSHLTEVRTRFPRGARFVRTPADGLLACPTARRCAWRRRGSFGADGSAALGGHGEILRPARVLAHRVSSPAARARTPRFFARCAGSEEILQP